MFLYPDALIMLTLALVLDGLAGDPNWLWRRVPHPVVWIGNLINVLDKVLNKERFSTTRRKIGGIVTVFILLGLSVAAGKAVHVIAGQIPYGGILIALIAAILIAQKSLYQHVHAVRVSLQDKGLDAGRKSVALIVGRDPKRLDEPGVCRAAIESCAENFSDGVAAPVFWFAVAGLPGLIAYKALNTADSMIGHKSKRYKNFGWAAARLDDLVNLPASRLSALLFALSAPLVGGSPLKALTTFLTDAKLHRSPNAGWPEAAMAGALGIALAGPRIYDGYTVDDPFLNAKGRMPAQANDIARALIVMVSACVMLTLLVFLGAIFL